jgi:hypothetical protein
VDACPVKPRASVQVALTVAEPAEAPAVLRVPELPLPETLPAVEVQFATETGTPSGLVQVQVMLAEPPITTEDGLAEQLMVGGFFGGSGLIV